MRANDQKKSLVDYVKFLVATPSAPGLEAEMSAIRRLHRLLQTCPDDSAEESCLALSLVQLLYRLRDKKLKLGVR